MIGLAFVAERMSITQRPVLWRGIDLEVDVMVWDDISQHHRTELVVIAGKLNAVLYREAILLPRVVSFQLAHPA